MTKKRKPAWAWVGFANILLCIVLAVNLLAAGIGAIMVIAAFGRSGGAPVQGLLVVVAGITGASMIAAMLGALELLEAIARQTRQMPPS